MVYELRCYTLRPGKMPEYLKAAETIGRPARGQNFGVNHGYWTAEFGALNQIWHLWKYDSYEERTRLRGELGKNKAWTEGYVPVIRPLIQRQDLRLMNPVVDILPDDGTTRRSGAPGPASSRSPTNGSTSGATRISRSASRRAAMR